MTGLGIESSSFRNGLPHESVREMEILTGDDGRGRSAPADGDHADLFRAFPNSYGSPRLRARLTIELEPVLPLRSRCATSASTPRRDASTRSTRIMRRRTWDGERVDFVDGVGLRPATGRPTSRSATGLTCSSGTCGAATTPAWNLLPVDPAAHHRSPDRRATTCGDGTPTGSGARGPLARSTASCGGSGHAVARTDVYRRLVALDHATGVSARIDHAARAGPEEAVVQDVEIPARAAPPSSSTGSSARCRITPIWLCPLQLRDTSAAPGALGANPAGRPVPSQASPAAYPRGRCTRSRRVSPTSTSASGRPSPIAPGREAATSTAHRGRGDAAGRARVPLLRVLLRRTSTFARPLRRRRVHRASRIVTTRSGRFPTLFDKAVRCTDDDHGWRGLQRFLGPDGTSSGGLGRLVRRAHGRARPGAHDPPPNPRGR